MVNIIKRSNRRNSVVNRLINDARVIERVVARIIWAVPSNGGRLHLRGGTSGGGRFSRDHFTTLRLSRFYDGQGKPSPNDFFIASSTITELQSKLSSRSWNNPTNIIPTSYFLGTMFLSSEYLYSVVNTVRMEVVRSCGIKRLWNWKFLMLKRTLCRLCIACDINYRLFATILLFFQRFFRSWTQSCRLIKFRKVETSNCRSRKLDRVIRVHH